MMEAKGINNFALIHQNVNIAVLELTDICATDKNNAVAIIKLN